MTETSTSSMEDTTNMTDSVLQSKVLTKEIAIFLFILKCIIAVCTIWSNCLVFYTYFKKRHLRTLTDLAIVSLAIVDLITGCGMPLDSVSSYLPTLLSTSDELDNQFCFIKYLILQFSCQLSIMHLTLLMLERYIKLAFTDLYNAYVTRQTMLGAITTLWLCQILVTVLPMTLGAYIWQPGIPCHMAHVFKKEIYRFTMSQIGICLIIDIIVFIATCLYILRLNRIVEPSGTSNASREKYLTKTVFSMTVLFWFSWLQVFFIVIFVKIDPEGGSLASFVVVNISVLVAQLNSLVNPWVYMLRNKEGRNNIYRLLGCQVETNVVRIQSNDIPTVGPSVDPNPTGGSNPIDGSIEEAMDKIDPSVDPNPTGGFNQIDGSIEEAMDKIDPSVDPNPTGGSNPIDGSIEEAMDKIDPSVDPYPTGGFNQMDGSIEESMDIIELRDIEVENGESPKNEDEGFF
ncbi:unnamed protein product [Owenia fusiformis]|uniref:Uncharacterized protein n=1 Tax=Owenia fusiformis TaxID=6347 RepID=A0A8J1TLN6_OWEFU|nr:unnamed protein product [Owenia fusiformis]